MGINVDFDCNKFFGRAKSETNFNTCIYRKKQSKAKSFKGQAIA